MLNLLGHCPLVATPPMIPAPALLWPFSAWFVCLFECVLYPLCVCSASLFSLHHLADGLPPFVCGLLCSPATFSKSGAFLLLINMSETLHLHSKFALK
ncbi:hypothetical protein QL285_078650 [Trifolium repens]|nr:hypothetical protein QL285_078650 [Trifolium repens]